MNTDLFYLLGALRDASFDLRNGKNYELRIYQKSEAWLENISDLLGRNFGVSCRIKNNLLRLNGKAPILDLVALSEYVCPQEFWATPRPVREALPEEVWWYAGGFFDSEGGVPLNPETTTQTYVSFDQKSKEPLEFLRNFFLTQKIIPTHLTFTSQAWQFRITRREHLKKFYSSIHSFHPEKLERLSQLIATFP